MYDRTEIADAFIGLANIWLDFLEKQYDERLWGAMQMLLKKSSQDGMDIDLAYKAGLVWCALYDLAAASNKIKNEALFVSLIDGVSRRYDIDSESLMKVSITLAGIKLPHIIFLDIYSLLDTAYNISEEKREEVVEGFVVFSNKLISFGYLGDLLSHKF